MSHELETHLVAFDARRRRIGVRILNPFRPGRAVAFAALPAQYLGELFRRHAIDVVEKLAVEMIGARAVIGLHAGKPDSRRADDSSGAGEQSKEAAAGEGHGAGCSPEIVRGLYGRNA